MFKFEDPDFGKIPAKAGRLLALTQGEYSDYGVIGFFVILTNFNPKEQLEKFLTDHPEEKEDYWFEHSMFTAFLIKNGFLLELEYDTFHLGSYNYYRDAGYRLPYNWESIQNEK